MRHKLRSASTPPVHVAFSILGCLCARVSETRRGVLTSDAEQKPGRVARLGVHVRAGIQCPGKSEILRRRVCVEDLGAEHLFNERLEHQSDSLTV